MRLIDHARDIDRLTRGLSQDPIIGLLQPVRLLPDKFGLSLHHILKIILAIKPLEKLSQNFNHEVSSYFPPRWIHRGRAKTETQRLPKMYCFNFIFRTPGSRSDASPFALLVSWIFQLIASRSLFF